MASRRRIDLVIEEEVERPVLGKSRMAALMLLVVVASACSGSTGTTPSALAPTESRSQTTDLLDALLDAGLLPRYAFPVDVVQLHTEPLARQWNTERGLQRDLSIALSEYAPGSEVIRDTGVQGCCSVRFIRPHR